MGITVFFYNPNIHPYREFRKRLANVRDYCNAQGVAALYNEEYDLEKFLRAVLGKPVPERCGVCYAIRLDETARTAREKALDAFSTTLLVSPHQHREAIKAAGQAAGETGIARHTRKLATWGSTCRATAGAFSAKRSATGPGNAAHYNGDCRHSRMIKKRRESLSIQPQSRGDTQH
jgi:hypothetical protein